MTTTKAVTSHQLLPTKPSVINNCWHLQVDNYWSVLTLFTGQNTSLTKITAYTTTVGDQSRTVADPGSTGYLEFDGTLYRAWTNFSLAVLKPALCTRTLKIASTICIVIIKILLQVPKFSSHTQSSYEFGWSWGVLTNDFGWVIETSLTQNGPSMVWPVIIEGDENIQITGSVSKKTDKDTSVHKSVPS